MSELDPKTVYGYLDVAHRADLAAASRKAWRWGLVAGAVAALALAVGAFVVVRRARPEWLAPRADSAQRAPLAPLSTPWSPTALDAVPDDEHARESEQAKQDARDMERR